MHAYAGGPALNQKAVLFFHVFSICCTTFIVFVYVLLPLGIDDDDDDDNKKLSYHKQTVRLLHNIEIRVW